MGWKALRPMVGRTTVLPNPRAALHLPPSAADPVQIQPINLTAIVAIVMGVSIVLIPVAGATLRFALKPITETLGKFMEHRRLDETVRIMERRMELLEAQSEAMEQSLNRIVDGVEFDRKLRVPREDDERVLTAGNAGDGSDERP